MKKILFKDYPDTTTPINAENLNEVQDNVENAIGLVEEEVSNVDDKSNNISDYLKSGWIPANETWTYSSVDDPTGVITVEGDVTSKYSLGMRIKFTNATNAIYGIITAINYSSPNTVLTFLHEINPMNSQALHLMENSVISNNYYSTMKVPFGFPTIPTKWSIKTVDTTLRKQNFPTADTWYNFISITVPIGAWILSHNVALAIQKTSNGYIGIYVTLSTTNNGVTDNELTANIAISSSAQSNILEQRCVVYKDKIVDLASKTKFYQNVMTPDSGIAYIATQNNVHYDVIKAVCAYL